MDVNDTDTKRENKNNLVKSKHNIDKINYYQNSWDNINLLQVQTRFL